MRSERYKSESESTSSKLELESEFSERLRSAIGDRSVLSFAKACGFSDSLVRKYLAGSLPGLDKAVIMADKAGVSLEWLATGRGCSSLPDNEAVLIQEVINLRLLEDIIGAVRSRLRRTERELSPESEARVIRLLYQLSAERENKLDEGTVMDLVEIAADAGSQSL